jgi:hypothetical protein
VFPSLVQGNRYAARAAKAAGRNAECAADDFAPDQLCPGEIGFRENPLIALEMPKTGMKDGCLQKSDGWLQMSWWRWLSEGSCFLNVLVEESQNTVDST